MFTYYEILHFSLKVCEAKTNKSYNPPPPKLWNIWQNLFVSGRALSCFMNSEWCCRWWSNKVVTGAAGALTVSEIWVRASSIIWVQPTKEHNELLTINMFLKKLSFSQAIYTEWMHKTVLRCLYYTHLNSGFQRCSVHTHILFNLQGAELLM